MALNFNFKNTIINEKQARYLKLNTEGELAHFYGANGFPLGATVCSRKVENFIPLILSPNMDPPSVALMVVSHSGERMINSFNALL